MPNRINVRVGEEWHQTDDIYVWSQIQQRWKEVLAAFVWTDLQGPDNSGRGFHWETMFDNYQAPPVLRSVSGSHSAATIAWDAPLKATDYRILRRASHEPGVVRVMPAAPGWQSGLSYTWTGLEQDRSYTFTVIAKRTTTDGHDVVSAESNPVTLNTGHAEVRHSSGGNIQFLATSSGSRTWDSDVGWRNGSDVEQGYKGNASPSKNANGAVRYSTLPEQVAATYGQGAADNCIVADAYIDKVYRKPGGGSGNPNIDVYASNINFGFDSRNQPSRVGEKTGFSAPLQYESKENFRFGDSSKLIGWAQQWMDRYPYHNGIVLYRNDGGGNATNGYNGYCIFRSANEQPSDWRLVLAINWNYVSTALQSPWWS